jgi:hypothetical protein
MEKKKAQDLVSGRLNGDPSRKARSRDRRKSTYGTGRLGITAADDAEPTEAKPPAAEPAEKAEKRVDPRLAALSSLKRQAQRLQSASPPLAGAPRPPAHGAPSPAPVTSRPAGTATQAHALQPPSGGLAKYNPRVVVSVAAAIGVGVIALVWILASSFGSDKPSPPVAAAQNPGAPARPAPPAPRRPDRYPSSTRQRPGPHATTRPGADGATTPAPVGKTNSLLRWARLLSGARGSQAKVGSPPAPGTPTGTTRRPVVPSRGKPAPTSPRPKPPATTKPAAGKTRDTSPTKPWQYGPCPPGITLTGIVHQSGEFRAGINGRFVRVGDVVRGAKVLRITPLNVEMERDGIRFLVGFSRPTRPSWHDDPDSGEGEDEDSDEADAGDDDSDKEPAEDEDDDRSKNRKKSKKKRRSEADEDDQ